MRAADVDISVLTMNNDPSPVTIDSHRSSTAYVPTRSAPAPPKAAAKPASAASGNAAPTSSSVILDPAACQGLLQQPQRPVPLVKSGRAAPRAAPSPVQSTTRPLLPARPTGMPRTSDGTQVRKHTWTAPDDSHV